MTATITPEAIDKAATTLLAARRGGYTIAVIPEDCRPASVDDGYLIQDEVARRLGERIVGWKIGCTAKDQQAFLKVDGPFAGRIFAYLSFDSPATVRGGQFHMRGIEGEFAFRLARDLPARAAPYSRAEVEDAVAAVHPTIEIVNTRYDDWLKVGAPSLVADNGAHGGFVLGPGATDWRGLDLPNHRVTMTIDGKEVSSGTGSAALGDPMNALVWLANDRARRGDGLKAGHVITTGTCCGLNKVGPVAEAVADHGSLGKVSVRFVA